MRGFDLETRGLERSSDVVPVALPFVPYTSDLGIQVLTPSQVISLALIQGELTGIGKFVATVRFGVAVVSDPITTVSELCATVGVGFPRDEALFPVVADRRLSGWVVRHGSIVARPPAGATRGLSPELSSSRRSIWSWYRPER
jgi:hypothetical protein